MEWDIGLKGLGTLMVMALAFGLLAQMFAGRGITPWMWAISASVFFVAGLLISEVWFGWATEEELQPNIDGLSRDEALLAIFPGIAAVAITRHLSKRQGQVDRNSVTIPPAAIRGK